MSLNHFKDGLFALYAEDISVKNSQKNIQFQLADMLKNKVFPIICSIFLLFTLTSCEKVEDLITESPIEGSPQFTTTTYTIKKGQHSTSNKMAPLAVTKMAFKVTFDSSAIYKTKNPENQADINKLYGLSDCSSHHHQNSARFGWRWFNGQLEIHAYGYSAGKRSFTFITSVELNEENTYTLELTENEYIFKVKDKVISMERACSGTSTGYKLYPYFGGDEKAPHNITITIEDLSTN